MNAETLANNLSARRVGNGRWIARCVAHADKQPSLSITQGTRGILLKCRSAGCTLDQICAAIGIKPRELFSDSGTTPQEAQRLALERVARDATQNAARIVDRQKRWKLWALWIHYQNVLKALIRDPGHAELGARFHAALEEWRELDCELYPEFDDGPLLSVPLEQPPSWIASALADIGQTFNSKNSDSAPTESDLEKTGV